MNEQPLDPNFIFAALESPKFKWRTIDGVAAETGVSPDAVRAVIEQNRGRIIQSTVPAASGQALFTTREHFIQKSTPFEKIVGAFKNRVG